MKPAIAVVVTALAFLAGAALFSYSNRPRAAVAENRPSATRAGVVTDAVVGTDAVPLASFQDHPVVIEDRKRAGGDKAAWNHDQGVKAFKAKDYDLAISYFNEALRLRPGHVPTLEMRCRSRAFAGKFQEAQEDADEVIRLAKDRKALVVAHGLRGLVSLGKGQHQAAVEDATEAMRIDPSAPAPYLIRAEAYLSQRRLDDAVRDASSAIRLSPRDAYAYVLRGRAHLAKKDPDRAYAEYSRAIELEATAENYLHRAVSLAAKKAWQEAIHDAQEAADLEPNNERAHWHLAWFFAVVGDNKLARHHSDRVKQLRRN